MCIFIKNKALKCIVESFLRINIILYILVWVFLSYGVLRLYVLLPFDMSNLVPTSILEYKENPFEFYFLTLIFAPVLETLISQTLIIKFTQKVLKIYNKKWVLLPIFLSAICFALQHIYNLNYVCLTFLGGLVFAGCYVMTQYRVRKVSPTLIVIIVHSLYNLTISLVAMI